MTNSSSERPSILSSETTIAKDGGTEEHNRNTLVETESLEILYRDDSLIAINKPSGLLVHRSPIDRHETRFAIQLLRDQIGQRVYPAHRLDKPTSGVLLFALDKDTASKMGEAFRQHQLSKTYLAVVRGHCPDQGTIDHALREDPDSRIKRQEDAPAQDAISHYRCLAKTVLDVEIETYPQSRYSLVEVEPETGRRHQIRRHLKHISHPIIGDAKHGRGRHNRYFATELNCPRLLLHAQQLKFDHPITGASMIINAPLDDCFYQLLKRFDWQDRVEKTFHPEK
ncbi:tRNA pseudouridine(65) synthase TruC [Spongiibacter sp. KMU-158]|uniref:Pseudouridine synthase n=1 Tax=Spongiibacter pelagi TaxID=2760804 RepID=A0A927C2C9_9GAMM|nr:tRNA pseudouridine(65) synthase TruC [Spongiibacter pelagi]MBD2858516.1 tRNA pseudouridine(65) synthase TruC [Spongiibacter pelagi]